SAGAIVIQPADDQIYPAVLRVVVDLAGDDQLLAVFGQKRQPPGGAAEDHRSHIGRGVFEREPDVATAQRDAADLAFDDDTLKASREQVVDARVQLQDRERFDRLLRLDRHLWHRLGQARVAPGAGVLHGP